jgi:oxygen-independent coproporphyrinogen-3 oxidase
MTDVANFMSASGKDVKLQTIHFGGGTPSVLRPGLLGKLIEHARKTFDASGVIEIAMEGVPATFTAEYLAGMKDVGISAVSMGVQSFEDDDLKTMGRGIDIGKNRRAVENAVATGFKNVTLDLINGLPNQSEATFFNNLQTAVDVGVKTMQVCS